MKFRNLLRGVSLLVLLVSLIPANHIAVAAPVTVPPVDMFQLPWDQGLAWYAIDGLDNGTKRPVSSSHNYKVGGAIDFAPRTNMKTGENTSNFWVTAAASGTVVQISSCHMKILHSDGWLTEYQFLGNIQVKLGDAVVRNQRLGVIADGVKYKYCSGYVEPNVPHLHFMLRPTLVGATFAGWQVNYSSFWNSTTFTKDGNTVGLFKPLLNAPGSTPTPTPLPSTATPVPTGITPTPTGPYVSTEVDPASVGVGGIASATVRLNSVPVDGYTSAEFTCSYDADLVEVNNIAVVDLFGADAAVAINDPQNGSFIVAVAGSQGNKATASGVAFTFDVKGLQAGSSVIGCDVRVNTGNNILTSLPAIGDVLTIVGDTPTPTFVPTQVASSTPIIVATPTSPIGDWLTFTNSTFAFEFKYPPQGSIDSGASDNFARIYLPKVPGTNLGSKYLEVLAGELSTDPCQSPLATQSMLETSENVIINGLTFLKQTGQDGSAGHINKWVAYSISRDNVCVNFDFILRIANPGNFATPPPLVDEAAESAVFGQIVATFAWLTGAPTATPFATFTPTSVGTFTPTVTVTSPPVASPTFTALPTVTPVSGAILNGRVIASKVVTVRVYDLNENFIAAVNANPDGTFSLPAPAGSFTVVATANGFLRIQGSITLAEGDIRAMPEIALLAGDIDDNNEIDQFDAMTIGFNYNTIEPPGADLNNDGIINVLDLELLAQNYRKTGPVPWE
jgi:hypothetical protein